MLNLTFPRTAVLAATLIGAAAFAPMVVTDTADAAESRNELAADRNNDRDLHRKRGPFFGLRVNSITVNSKTKSVACFRYRCGPIVDDGMPSVYHVIRSAHVDSDVNVGECDEVMKRAFMARNVTFRARATTTRWIRDVGPNGTTPIGGFIGRMDVNAVWDDADGKTHRLPYVNYRLVATQGLRPRNAFANQAEPGETSRCDAPWHDEGYFEARADRRGLRKLLKHFGDDPVIRARLARWAQALGVGTFEGTTFINPEQAKFPYDFCALDEIDWAFDGVVAFRCRPPTPDITPVDVSASVAVDVTTR